MGNCIPLPFLNPQIVLYINSIILTPFYNGEYWQVAPLFFTCLCFHSLRHCLLVKIFKGKISHILKDIIASFVNVYSAIRWSKLMFCSLIKQTVNIELTVKSLLYETRFTKTA